MCITHETKLGICSINVASKVMYKPGGLSEVRPRGADVRRPGYECSILTHSTDGSRSRRYNWFVTGIPKVKARIRRILRMTVSGDCKARVLYCRIRERKTDNSEPADCV